MTNLTPSDLRTRLAAEFEARGWEYDLVTGKAIAERAERDGRIEPTSLARAVPNGFLQRTSVTRDQLEAAIEHAVGGHGLRVEERAPVTLVFNNDNRYQLNMGARAQIAGSQVNVRGTQINVRVDSPKEDVMASVAELVRAGLREEWNPEAARELAGVVDTRDDVTPEDVESVVKEVIAKESPESRSPKRMLQAITEQGLGGALTVGIVKALTLLLAGI